MDKKLKFTDNMDHVKPLLLMMHRLGIFTIMSHRYSHAMMMINLSAGIIPADPKWIPLPVTGLLVEYWEITPGKIE